MLRNGIRVITLLYDGAVDYHTLTKSILSEYVGLCAAVAGHIPNFCLPGIALALHDIRVRERDMRELGVKLVGIRKRSGMSPWSWLGLDNRGKPSIAIKGELNHGEIPIAEVARWSRELGNHLLADAQSLRSADVAEAALKNVEEMIRGQGAV